MSKWIKITDCLPEKHQYVLLLADRYWNTPEGVPDMKVTACGYLAEHGKLYWSVFGERGFDINAFTHWTPIPNEGSVETTEDKVKRMVQRFNQDDIASIAHALMHLENNKIADDNYPGYGGWYCGNRAQFVRRHKKAVALLRSLLATNQKLKDEQ